MAAQLGELLREVAGALREAGIDNAAREARVLVQHFAGVEAAEIIARPEREIDAAREETTRQAARRRAAGEPLHRIIGRRAFYGIELKLSPHTLEPRPDTEILVDRVLPHVRRIIARQGTCKVLDLGTGTGAIALAILVEAPEATAIGVDFDEEAVATAMENARINGLDERFSALQSDWFEAVNEKFHVLVSNPPYISETEFESLPEDVRLFDPKIALVGGADGLQAYRAIAQHAAGYLMPGGIVGIEIGYRQSEDVSAIFARHDFQLVEQASDLAGHDRVLIFAALEA